MKSFPSHPSIERRRLCEAAGDRLGLHAASVEKDFWVCWSLQRLFSMGDFGPHLTFKGGTSLSKCWKLIQRFSEDIDVVIDRTFLGFSGSRSPEKASSGKRREKCLEDLKRATQTVIRTGLFPALQKDFKGVLPKELNWNLIIDPDDRDEQTILFQYPTVFPPGGYLRPVVKIELGARSDVDPTLRPEIRSYLDEGLPGESNGKGFFLRTVSPERTFWEKAMLLHEETYRDGGPVHKPRLARHYYDLSCLILAGIGERALSNAGLFSSVAAHRVLFFRKTKQAQETLRPGSLRLLPLRDRQIIWKRDYEAMRDAMFFGESPPFVEIMKVVGDFEKKFNRMAS
jgi:hypothetical protein